MDNFYLCNPDDEKSCGACCGLYNFYDHSEDFITGILRKRKENFNKYKNDLKYFRKIVEDEEEKYTLSKTIYTCPFLSFIDEEEKKVGCMIHPKVTGEELRDVAFYGSEVCNEHRCTAYIYFKPVETEAVLRFTHDWYLYGLVLHDIDFVKSFFNLIEEGIARKIKVSDLENPESFKLWEKYFSLKRDWPFMNKKGNILDKYEFSGKLFKIRDLETFGVLEKNSNLYKILRALESEFFDKKQLEQGRRIVVDIVDSLIDVYK